MLGTPEALRVPLAEDPEFDHRTLTVFEDREVPEGFWHNDRLHYSTFLQDHEAPLIFVIAGTGADDQSLHMRTLGQVLHGAGIRRPPPVADATRTLSSTPAPPAARIS